MKKMRIKSRESQKYHRCGCKYEKQINKENRVELSLDEAKNRGFQPCKYCNSMSFLYQKEKRKIEWYRANKKMDFLLKDGMLYVKTEIGCWRLVYSRNHEHIALYHRNTRQAPLDFQYPERGKYHRQKDKYHFHSIDQVLCYIYDHDKYKKAEKRGDKNIVYRSKKYKKQAERRKARAEHRRVDRLFQKIERENEEYLRCSIC